MSIGEMFKVAVEITAIDHLTRPMKMMEGSMLNTHNSIKEMNKSLKMMGASKAEIKAMTRDLERLGDVKAFSSLSKDLTAIGKSKEEIAAIEQSFMKMRNYQREMAELQGKYNAGKELASSGVHDLAIGAVGAWGVMELVKKAGEFQANMTVIQDSTGASTKQMQKFGDAVMNTSAAVSKFNDMEVAQIAQTLTSGGFNKIGDAQKLMLPVSKFAESQMYEHKASDPIESTKQAIEMSHLFGHYDTKSFENFLNTFNKYSMMQPGDSSQLQQTIKYLAPTANTLHMKEKDTMALAAVANTLGLSGSHGGTNAADMIMRMVPGISGGMPKPILDKKGNIKGYKKSRSWKAMEELGFIDKQGNSQFFNKDGSLRDLDGMLKTMIELSKTMNPMKLTAAYHDIFGIQGGRAASIFSNPRSMEQLEKMRGQLGKTKSMEQINNDLQNTPEGQMNLFKSNSMSLMLRVGQQLAIMLNPAIKSLNKFMGGLLKFSEAHPGIAKIVGDFALLMVGGKLLSGVIKLIVGNVQMANAAFKMFKLKNAAGEATKLAKGLKGLGTAFKFMGTGTLAVIKILGRFSGFLIKLGIQAARWAIGIAADWLVAMGPVGWIIAGVTAIIAAGILMWNKNFLGFRDGLTRIWKDIKQIFNTYIHAWADYGKIFVDLFTGHFGDLKKDFMKLVDDLLGIFKPVTDIFSTIGKGGKNLWNWAKGGSENLWNWATGGGNKSGPTHKSGNTTNHYNINVNSNNGKQFAQDFHKETRKMNMNTSPYPTFGAMP